MKKLWTNTTLVMLSVVHGGCDGKADLLQAEEELHAKRAKAKISVLRHVSHTAAKLYEKRLHEEEPSRISPLMN